MPNIRIHLWGDIVVSANKLSKFEKYPLRKVEDILATLGVGLHFTKIDLNQVYLQLSKDEN